ncbi:MAG: hypothetical protein CO133_01875 [Candidatus Komeilibacteria bacterium CG_4_9_14_3_um_filter_37_5]|nr:MAG: hypothetical protein CO133_01875 [Candidatus Komeilibacteria bacterium CG_4_9_14_3_um_filter_37_5]
MSEDIKKIEKRDVVEDELMDQPKKQKASSKSLMNKIIIVVIVVIVILGGLYFVNKYTALNIFGDKSDKVVATDWEAVFLSNGQVYFGKVVSEGSKEVVLKDIYYLQVVQRPLQTTETGNTQVAQDQQQTQQELSLVKLGNELHGPVDEMTINAAHILFTEKLKSDSKVIDAISRYVAEQNAAATK